MLKWNIQDETTKIVNKYENRMGPNLMFITITLKPKLYKFQATTQYELTVCEIQHIFNQRCNDTTFVCEITEAGNIHYHAMTIFTDKVRKLCFIDAIKRNKHFGFMKITPNSIDHIDNLTRSANYLTKELLVTSKILNKPGYTPEILKYL